MTNSSSENLRQLLSSYFHQDWPDEFDSDIAALHAIVQHEPGASIANSVRELEAILKSPPADESAFNEYFERDLGCFVAPESLGLSHLDWLKRVRDAFSARIALK